MGRRTRAPHSLDTIFEQETWYGARPGYIVLPTSYPFLDDFTPWQIIVSTLTAVYAMRNADKLIGLGGEFPHPIRKPRKAQLSSPIAPEPLARLVCSSRLFLPLPVCNYSCSMLHHIIAQLGSTLAWTQALQPLCIFARSGYETSAQSFFLYIILFSLMRPTRRCVDRRVLACDAKHHNQQLRKFRTAPTVEMLRVTWEKTSNPFVRTFIAAL